MSKYIIDIADEPVGGLYKAKAFNTLVFDAEGLNRLEKVEDDGEAKTYFYITDRFEIKCIPYFGTEEDRVRKEIGNYFKSFEAALKTKQRILIFMNNGSADKDVPGSGDHLEPLSFF